MDLRQFYSLMFRGISLFILAVIVTIFTAFMDNLIIAVVAAGNA